MNPTSTTCETNGQANTISPPPLRSPSQGPIKTVKGTGSLNSKPTIWCLLRALRKNLWIALLVALVVGGSVTAAIWLLMPPAKHTVIAQVRIKEVPDKVLFPPEKEHNFDMFRRTQVALIKGDRVLTTALDQDGVKKISFVKKNVEPVRELEKQLQVTSKDSPEILQIVLEGDQPEEFQLLVDAITDAYIHHFGKDLDRRKEEKGKELSGLKKSYNLKIAAKWDELNDLTRSIKASNVSSISINQQVALMMLSLAENELAKINLKKIHFSVELQNEERKYFKDYSFFLYSNPGNPTPLVAAWLLDVYKLDIPLAPVQGMGKKILIQDKTLNEYHQALENLEFKLRNGLEAFNEEKQKEKKEEFQKQINEIKGFIAARKKELGQVEGVNEAQFESRLDYLRHELGMLTTLEDIFKKEVQKQSALRDSLAEAGPKMEKIRKELGNLEDTEKKISFDLEALEVEKNAPSRVDILSKAKIYPPPVFGRKETMMGMGGVGSFSLVLLGFAYLGFRAQRVDSRDQIVQTLGINFIGSVPDFSYRPGLKFLKSRQQEEMVRDRMILDSVDAVRTMLLSRAKEEQLKVVMVTSALGGEGKTSTAGHLATSLARVGQKTLLVDCDLRNPHIHRLFNVSRGPGMSEVLHGKNDCMEVIQPSFTDSLSILSAGDFSTQTLQYFCGEKILEIIQKLKSQYDFIIVDSSPILFVPEAQILSQCSDGVILSVMRNVSRLPKVHSACDLLERLCARNLGFIINGVSDQTYLSSSYYYLPSP